MSTYRRAITITMDEQFDNEQTFHAYTDALYDIFIDLMKVLPDRFTRAYLGY